MERRRVWDFSSAESLARWYLTTGREAMEGAKAIDYSKSSHVTRDYWELERQRERYALAVLAWRRLTIQQTQLLMMAYRGVDDGAGREVVEDKRAGQLRLLPPLTDLQIAERLRCSRRKITDDRNTALRVLKRAADEVGLVIEEAA